MDILHFLLIIPFLLAFSMIVIYIASLFSAKPSPDKLSGTVWSAADFRAESKALAKVPFYSNYRFWGAMLLAGCAAILIIFS